MVKFVEFDSVDEYGIHVRSIEPNQLGLTKIASNDYSKDIMDAISTLKRESPYYYVVINALGSFETWGMNRNGDSFPRAGLSHLSLRSDMGTDNDYGYKTFEWYASLYRNHVNKQDSPKFGKVLHSAWNPKIERVELIVGIDKFKGKDIIDAVENGDNVSVSMGARVKFDICQVCGNKAKTTKEYCYHLKNFMGKYATKEQADKWSKETGHLILPGAPICAINEKPKFFDISKVYIGAESTAFVLGKVASRGMVMPSAYIAEAEGITDEMIEKLATIGKAGQIKKNADIDKDIPDGQVIAQGKSVALRKIIDDKMQNMIPREESIPNEILDSLAQHADLRSILSTMFGMGIHPQPKEFQRIIIIKIGHPDVANLLDKNNLIFDPNADVEPIVPEVHKSFFSDSIARMLAPYLVKRSCFPDYVQPRMEKTAAFGQMDEPKILTPTNVLAGIAAIFAGLKLKAMGIGPRQVLDVMIDKPWIGTMLGAGLAYKMLMADKGKELSKMLVPAQNYENAFTNTYFSGHTKTSSFGESIALGTAVGLASLPAAYIMNAYNRKRQYETGTNLFPGAGVNPVAAAELVGGGTALASLLKKEYGKEIMSKVKNLR